MKEQIINEMLELKFNINSKGFNYWVDGIIFYHTFKNCKNCKIMTIYRYIADKYKTSVTNVERVMRSSSEIIKEELEKKLGYSISNKGLFAYMNTYLIERGVFK